LLILKFKILGAKREGERYPSKISNSDGLLVTVPPVEGSLIALFEVCGIGKGFINESLLAGLFAAHGVKIDPYKLNGKLRREGGKEYTPYQLTENEAKVAKIVLYQLIGKLSSVANAL
jgi:hypothetical protein